MRIAQIMLCLGVVVVQVGCGAVESMVSAQPADGKGEQSPRERVAEGSGDASDPAIVLTYRLPSGHGGESTVEPWKLAAPHDGDGYSDPNRIVYDDAYIDAYVDWAATSPIACGAANYEIAVDEGVRQVTSGLDERYLGTKFRAEALVEFLKSRVEGESVERTFRVSDPELVRVFRDNPELISSHRVRQSPWDHDTCAIVTLLGLARHKPALPFLTALLDDAGPDVRNSTVMALGHLGVESPEAVDELGRLLADEQLGSNAATALAIADDKAVPALIKALDSEEWIVRNLAVHTLTRISFPAAEPALLKALEHRDLDVRTWAVAAVSNMQSSGVSIDSDQIIDALGRRLADGKDSEIRAQAAIALLNAGPRAARVRKILERAAAEDRGHRVADYARQALDALDNKQ